MDHLVEEFEAGWKPELGDYSRKLVEFCSSKALFKLCQNIEERICNGSYSRFTYDMMLAWEKPSAIDDEESQTVSVLTSQFIAKTGICFSSELQSFA